MEIKSDFSPGLCICFGKKSQKRHIFELILTLGTSFLLSKGTYTNGEFQSLPYSLLPDIAIVNVDCASDQFVSLFFFWIMCMNIKVSLVKILS